MPGETSRCSIGGGWGSGSRAAEASATARECAGDRTLRSTRLLRELRVARPSLTAKQRNDARAHLVADFANAKGGLAFRILERPIVARETRNRGALLAASHRDEHPRALREIVGELLRRSTGEIDIYFAHHFEHLGMHAR